MKITMYELLGMIKDGKAPKKIMFLGNTYRYDEIDETYRNIIGNTNIGEMHNLEFYLDDEVEIIEEKPTQEEIKEYTNKFLEAWIPVKKQFGKLFDEIARTSNVLDLEDTPKEEKKIPEKLNIINGAVDGKWENGNSYNYTLSAPQTVIIHKLNDVIDYLKSKGDE